MFLREETEIKLMVIDSTDGTPFGIQFVEDLSKIELFITRGIDETQEDRIKIIDRLVDELLDMRKSILKVAVQQSADA